MNFVYIGDLVNTHGIKGEVRIISDFKYKKQVFVPNFKLYIGKKKKELTINTYRTHKNYDMVTFVGINDINDVLIYKNEPVYVNKNDLVIDNYLDEDLIGLDVYDDKRRIGVIKDLLKNVKYNILVISNGDKEYLVPNISEFVLSVDLENRKVIINNMKGLIDDN